VLNSIRTVRRFITSRHAVRFALVFVGAVALTVATVQASGITQAHAASWLRYQRGYYVDQGWMCYGWTNEYHCTQHWYRTSSGALVSTNPAWVPNGLSNAGAPFQSVQHAAVSHPAPAPAPQYVAHPAAPAPVASSGSVTGEIQAVFGPYASQALHVAACESGYNPNAYNAGSGASGVFQFLPSTWAGTSFAGYSPFNASANIQAAHQVFVRDGYSWREWVCQP